MCSITDIVWQSNHQLQIVAAACGYELINQHHALADAEACAYIAMNLLSSMGSEELIRKGFSIENNIQNMGPVERMRLSI